MADQFPKGKIPRHLKGYQEASEESLASSDEDVPTAPVTPSGRQLILPSIFQASALLPSLDLSLDPDAASTSASIYKQSFPPLSITQTISSTTKTPKYNDSKLTFSGLKQDFPSWMLTLQLYITGNPTKFPDDATKITWVLSYMTGGPLAQVYAANQAKDGISTNQWGTWKDFQKDLTKHFQDSAVKEQALHFLANFKQGNRPAQDYFSLLELWFAHAELTNGDQKYHFTKNGISSQIHDWLTIIGFPKSYQALKDKMTQIDNDRRQQGNPLYHIDSRLSDAGSHNLIKASGSHSSS